MSNELRVQRVLHYMQENLEHDPTLEELAEVAHFSEYHFHRIFKAVTGETVAKCIKRLRLECAANRLLYEDMGVTDLAILGGFSSSQNFAKAFKGHFGVSPSEYRSKHSKNGNVIAKPECYSVSMEKLLIADRPAYQVAYQALTGAYGSPEIERGFAKMYEWAVEQGMESPQMLGVYWDNPEITDPDNCRSHLCVVVDDSVDCSAFNTQVIPGGRYANLRCSHDGTKFEQCWVQAYEALVAADEMPEDFPGNEFYDCEVSAEWNYEICIPVKN